MFCPQAAELSIKFLSGERAVEVVQVVGPRLAQRRKYNDVREEHTRRHTHTLPSVGVLVASDLLCRRPGR